MKIFFQVAGTTALLIATSIMQSVLLHAQPASLSVPLPSAITKAQTLFLGNAGDADNEDCMRAYSDFYAGLSNIGRFKVVLDPASADLILELHYEVKAGSVTGPHSPVDTTFARQFRLVLIDPHTHVILWNLTELENNAIFQSNRNKNLDNAVSQLLADFNALGQPSSSTSTGVPASKTRFSDENRK